MERRIQFLGVIGLVLLVFGMLTESLIIEDEFKIAILHYALGLICIAVFCLKGGVAAVGSIASRRKVGYGIGVTLYSILFLAMLVLVNFLVIRHDFIHYDTTEQEVFTLAPQTKEVLSSLENTVTVRAFFIADRIDDDLKLLLRRIGRFSDKFDWKLIDPEKQPSVAETFGVTKGRTIHFSIDTGDKKLETLISDEINEQEIANALIKLSRSGVRVVYYLKGNGEPDLNDDGEMGYLLFRDAVRNDNIELREYVLAPKRPIPADANAILLAAPRRDLLQSQLAVLNDYLASGGNALFLHEPRRSRDIADVVKRYGLDVGNNIVVDLLAYGETAELDVEPMVSDYPEPGVTGELEHGTVFSLVSSVHANPESVPDAKVRNIALSSSRSWAESNLELIFSDTPAAGFNEGDLKGPISIAAAYQGARPEKKNEMGDSEIPINPQRLIVVGDADFVSNSNLLRLFNEDFALNLVNWVIGEDKQVTIRSRSMRRSVKEFSAEQLALIFIATVVLIPEFLLLSGFWLWWFRKD